MLELPLIFNEVIDENPMQPILIEKMQLILLQSKIKSTWQLMQAL
jgi:hypothetical protein